MSSVLCIHNVILPVGTIGWLIEIGGIVGESRLDVDAARVHRARAMRVQPKILERICGLAGRVFRRPILVVLREAIVLLHGESFVSLTTGGEGELPCGRENRGCVTCLVERAEFGLQKQMLSLWHGLRLRVLVFSRQ